MPRRSVSRWLLGLVLLALLVPVAARRPAASPAAGRRAAVQFPDVPPVASYQIEVRLDAGAKTLEGHETISYTNATPQPIPDLVFHLYLNAFRDEDTIFAREGGLAHRGFGWDPAHAGWIEVLDLRLADGTPLALEPVEDGTLARADLPAPVAPGETLQVEVDFQAQLPRVFARTGYAGNFFMVGQWFPKLGVWQAGAWNAYPFHANAEFYADFGTYDVAITLPAEFVTGATGLPVSEEEGDNGTRTVRYRAEGVIDFAWTASPHFQEAARQVEGVELRYLYLPEHAWTVERALDAAEAALRYYGRWYGPYPYPRLTVVDVPDGGRGAGGMEYPMLFTAGNLDLVDLGLPISRDDDRSLELVVVHEAAHQWWQSVVASNEAEEPWLDEGLAEYSTLRLISQRYGLHTSAVDAPYLRLGDLDTRRLEYLSGPQVPIYGRAWDFQGLEYVVAAYSKPALSLLTLERVLGEEQMLALMSTYYHRYRFAHPTTDDFRAVAREVTGQDLDWFFEGLVYGDGVLNYRVAALEEHSLTVARDGELVVPTEVRITFADGSTLLEPWDGRQAEVTLAYPDRPAIHQVEIDPQRKVVVDLRWADNGLSRPLLVSPWLALVNRIVYALQNALLALGGL